MKKKIGPKKVSNNFEGQCDECGAPLLAFKWIDGECTGCTKKCAVAHVKRELRDLAED